MSQRPDGRPVKYIFVTAAWCRRWARDSRPRRLAGSWKTTAIRWRSRSSTRYINVDPGTMSPYQHGEVYVTDDGAETDLDLGHYERFTSMVATRNSN